MLVSQLVACWFEEPTRSRATCSKKLARSPPVSPPDGFLDPSIGMSSIKSTGPWQNGSKRIKMLMYPVTIYGETFPCFQAKKKVTNCPKIHGLQDQIVRFAALQPACAIKISSYCQLSLGSPTVRAQRSFCCHLC